MKKIMVNPKCGMLLLGAILLGNPISVQAETTKTDIQVGGKAAAFVQPALSGDVPTAIVYDSSNPESKADADGIAAAIGGGLQIKNSTLKPTLVDVSNLGALSSVKVAFLTHGMGGHQSAVASAAAQSGILTISNDMSCVESDLCVVGVESSPKVSIVVSKSATQASSLSFGSAFLMMVKER
ncbi:hypothetical protein [Emcibacter sp.]|uniref:hypothetical protein n=1 Tax=Emcibacter sp. TaxID=1979954 RepID=UPI003A8CE33F